jgi:hypothetical protein
MRIIRHCRRFIAPALLVLVCLQSGLFAADPAAAPVPPLGQSRTLNAPALGQWQIYRVEVSPPPNSKTPDQRNSFYTVLLDSATGETWMLSPSDKDPTHHFVWVRIDREQK